MDIHQITTSFASYMGGFTTFFYFTAKNPSKLTLFWLVFVFFQLSLMLAVSYKEFHNFQEEKLHSCGVMKPHSLISTISNAFHRLLVGELKSIMQLHSLICILLGIGTFLLPHRFYSNSSGYDHFAHEFVRLYGCLTLGIGYLVWCTKDIKDGRLLRALTETFALSYGLQAIAMLRAQLTSPSGHSTLHWCTLSLLICVSGLYTFCRFARKIKDFELPGFERGE